MTITGSFLPLATSMQPERVCLDIIERTAGAIVDPESLDAMAC